MVTNFITLLCPVYPYLFDLISCFQLLIFFATFYFSHNLTNFLLIFSCVISSFNLCIIYFIIFSSRLIFFFNLFHFLEIVLFLFTCIRHNCVLTLPFECQILIPNFSYNIFAGCPIIFWAKQEATLSSKQWEFLAFSNFLTNKDINFFLTKDRYLARCFGFVYMWVSWFSHYSSFKLTKISSLRDACHHFFLLLTPGSLLSPKFLNIPYGSPGFREPRTSIPHT